MPCPAAPRFELCSAPPLAPHAAVASPPDPRLLKLASNPAAPHPASTPPADFWTKGEVHTDGLITAGGLIMCCLGNFFMMLSGCAYAEVETARAAAVAAADGTSSEEDVKRGGGKSVGSFSTAV